MLADNHQPAPAHVKNYYWPIFLRMLSQLYGIDILAHAADCVVWQDDQFHFSITGCKLALVDYVSEKGMIVAFDISD